MAFTTPSKEQVRMYTQYRTTHKEPIPSMAEIRRQLGWSLIPTKGAKS